MSRRWLTLAALVALAPAALGQDREADPDESVATPHAAVYADALAERFLTCLAAEGGAPTPDDRAVVADVAAALGASVARGLGGDGCDDTPESQSACAAQVRALDCEQLGARLAPGIAPDTAPPPPAWAAGHARTVSRRIAACAAQERDGATLDDDERRGLDAFESGLAASLGAMQSTGACVVDENALPACARSVAEAPCEGLGARLDDDPGALARTVTPACAAMLRCGAGALDDGGRDDDAEAVDEALLDDDAR